MLIEHLSRRLRERDAQSLRRRRRIAESACSAHQRVSAEGCQGREMLAFCSNDYLGLANHPALIDALAEGARRYGAGSGASHLISGHSRAHAALEEDLAAFLAPKIADCATAIQPLIVGDNDAALALSAALASQSLWVPAIRPPTVPRGSARLRITLSAAHTRADVQRLVEGLELAARMFR